jgi:tRNA 2-thiouridine synthesizing protein A
MNVESKRETADLLRDLEGLEGAPCAGCARPLCGHHALIALVMGFKNAPRCAGCLAGALENPLEKFLDQVLELIRHRDCYRLGWAWAGGREKSASPERPECLMNVLAAPRMGVESPGVAPLAEWDAGSMGCGDLVLELRQRLAQVKPGGVLRVRATDPGAPEDLPAWCRLTGHSLIEANHPVYRIRRKES